MAGWLVPAATGWIVDATVGAGGHAALLLDAAPGARLLGVDRDPEAVTAARATLARFGDRVRLRQANFRDLTAVLTEEGADPVTAILLDLGVSSLQLDDPGRGFSFREAGPLDMRMGPDAPWRAADLLRTVGERELADLIATLGEDVHARRIARRILEARDRGELEGTADLARAVARAVPGGWHRIHPATRTFQALRIAVNGELEALDAALPQAAESLAPGGRLAVIAFHSLEDRRVKRFFAREARDCVCPPEVPRCRCGHVRRLRVLTRRPVTAADAEVARNPKARSAKLRVAERLPDREAP